MSSKEKKKKKNFASFSYKEAFKQLNVTELFPWEIEASPIKPSSFFHERMERLQCFDLQNYEESKKLIIDALCEEAIQPYKRLKIWKGAALSSDVTNGNVDYLIAERKRYLEAPFLCIVEAKKDDFEQGLAQCLVEMQACQWQNRNLGKNIDILGIVTNGDGWRFYKLTTQGSVYETLLYGIAHIEEILGLLRYIFQQCEENLQRFATQF